LGAQEGDNQRSPFIIRADKVPKKMAQNCKKTKSGSLTITTGWTKTDTVAREGNPGSVVLRRKKGDGASEKYRQLIKKEKMTR